LRIGIFPSVQLGQLDAHLGDHQQILKIVGHALSLLGQAGQTRGLIIAAHARNRPAPRRSTPCGGP
jgi:hypothetical protein